MTDQTNIAAAPFRPLRAARPAVDVERRPDGALLMRHPDALGAYQPTLLAALRRWSTERPQHTMLAARDANGAWRRVSFQEMTAQARSVAQALLHLDAKAGDVALILSGNSLEHAAFLLGATMIGVIAAPVSPAYALACKDFAKLRTVVATTRPRFVFAQDGAAFAPALRAVGSHNMKAITASETPADIAATPFSELLSTKATASVEEAAKAIGPDTVAKILFTSGSTGTPKGVLNTHRMMCANIAMGDSLLPPPSDGAPNPILSWLPWNHTAAGNALFNRALINGETYYIDDGMPAPKAFERTVRNIRDTDIRSYMDVPAGFAMLADALDADNRFCGAFFDRIEYVWYAGASLPQALHDRLQHLSVSTTGRRLPMLSGYGATETAPGVVQLHWPTDRAGTIGLPFPGVELKLLPLQDGRYELRARGPNVTSGYFNDPEATAKAFDEEGFYRLADAVRFIDPEHPIQGLAFAGRLAEDFKLLTGTFVNVGALRVALVSALAPLARDAVIVGHDRAHVGALVWPNMDACRTLLGPEHHDKPDAELLQTPALLQAFAAKLRDYNSANPASSMSVVRIALLATPPAIEANEITDKGYVNQAAALVQRADDVARLYAATESVLPPPILENTEAP